jgi:hypothetical protein
VIDRDEIISRVVRGLPVKYWEIFAVLDGWSFLSF